MRLFPILALAVALTACATPQALADRADAAAFAGERATIRALRLVNNQAMAARDLAGTMQIVADRYVLVGGRGGIRPDAATMRREWAEAFADPTSSPCVRTPLGIEVGRSTDGTRAAESGRWLCPRTTAAGLAEYRGSYFAHWHKQPDWRVVADVYVTLSCTGPGCEPR